MYLSIDSKNFDSVRDKGIEKAKEFLGGDEYDGTIDFDSDSLDVVDEETSINNGVITHSCSLHFKSGDETKKIGYFSNEIELDLDDLTNLVNFYMKKLGKLKTILEATK